MDGDFQLANSGCQVNGAERSQGGREYGRENDKSGVINAGNDDDDGWGALSELDGHGEMDL